ncbi:hypothetical protein ACFOON_05745 [Novosphingobium piscinae]|uniref:Uncharacterized protein n=1 Tax=Novosphingobium piscinae TaxID=1507448 RepID=A0A7X1FZ33_9SPHN|nr:hypothetical protein [Novosphingobium piscinae]MBC2669633.1 hypothetical protein [Novosphingobium piscinae]
MAAHEPGLSSHQRHGQTGKLRITGTDPVLHQRWQQRIDTPFGKARQDLPFHRQSVNVVNQASRIDQRSAQRVVPDSNLRLAQRAQQLDRKRSDHRAGAGNRLLAQQRIALSTDQMPQNRSECSTIAAVAREFVPQGIEAGHGIRDWRTSGVHGGGIEQRG